MDKIRQRILLVPRNIFIDKDPKCLVDFFSNLGQAIDMIDNDKDVKDCCQEVDLTRSRIISTKNQKIKEFHESTLHRMENPNSHFLIFNN